MSGIVKNAFQHSQKDGGNVGGGGGYLRMLFSVRKGMGRRMKNASQHFSVAWPALHMTGKGNSALLMVGRVCLLH